MEVLEIAVVERVHPRVFEPSELTHSGGTMKNCHYQTKTRSLILKLNRRVASTHSQLRQVEVPSPGWFSSLLSLFLHLGEGEEGGREEKEDKGREGGGREEGREGGREGGRKGGGREGRREEGGREGGGRKEGGREGGYVCNFQEKGGGIILHWRSLPSAGISPS